MIMSDLFKKRSRIFILCACSALLLCMVIILPNMSSARNSGNDADNDEDSAAELPASINCTLCNEQFDYEETARLDKYIESFLEKWEINGASLAVYKDGRIRYAKGYGWADVEAQKRMEPSNIMRIASLSKLITASAIMKMTEDSLISLNDKVFGEDGILNEDIFMDFRDRRVKNITVENLLRHQGGFTTWRGDPMFMTREIVIWNNLDSLPQSDQIIQHCLKYRLGFAPGTSTCYSNLGYLILSRIIEKKSGKSYEEYCQENILHPAGCYDMHIGKNSFAERYENEVRYYESAGADSVYACDNSGLMATRTYGGNDITGLQGAGGWVCSPAEYAMLIAHLDADMTTPDLLCYSNIEKMMNRSGSRLPIGWSNGSFRGDWTRTGSLAGTSAVAKKFKDGSIWVFITNTSAWKGSRFTRNIDYLLRRGKEMTDNLS